MTIESTDIGVKRGKDKSFEIFVTKKSNGRPQDLTGWTYIEVRLPGESASVRKFAPSTAAVDEIQGLVSSATPVSGSYKLETGGETTAAIAFNASAGDVQTALRALRQFSDLTVTGTNIQTGFVVTYTGNDGGRNQALLSVVENDMVDALSGSVTVTATTTQDGAGKEGVDVLEATCGHLKVFLNEEDTADLNLGLGQDFDVDVRIGSADLDIDPIKGILNVEDPAVATS